MSSFESGDKVKWSWGQGHGTGTVQSVFTEKTTRQISGNEVVRHGSKDDPALYIDSDDGSNVLKLASECESA